MSNPGEKVFEQLVDTVLRKEAYAQDSSDDYWLASDCMPIEDEEWANSMY